MKISQWFDRHEFACKCNYGCNFDTVDTELLNLCNIVRMLNEGPVIVSSGCRCVRHNEDVSGSKNSQHLYGRASDLIVTDPLYIYDQLCKRFKSRYGFGLYDGWVHLDSRSGPPARWTVE